MAQSLCVSHFGKHYIDGLVFLGCFFCIIFYFLLSYIYFSAPLCIILKLNVKMDIAKPLI